MTPQLFDSGLDFVIIFLYKKIFLKNYNGKIFKNTDTIGLSIGLKQTWDDDVYAYLCYQL